MVLGSSLGGPGVVLGGPGIEKHRQPKPVSVSFKTCFRKCPFLLFRAGGPLLKSWGGPLKMSRAPPIHVFPQTCFAYGVLEKKQIIYMRLSNFPFSMNLFSYLLPSPPPTPRPQPTPRHSRYLLTKCLKRARTQKCGLCEQF